LYVSGVTLTKTRLGRIQIITRWLGKSHRCNGKADHQSENGKGGEGN
jgi:hypothetical protein